MPVKFDDPVYYIGDRSRPWDPPASIAALESQIDSLIEDSIQSGSKVSTTLKLAAKKGVPGQVLGEIIEITVEADGNTISYKDGGGFVLEQIFEATGSGAIGGLFYAGALILGGSPPGWLAVIIAASGNVLYSVFLEDHVEHFLEVVANTIDVEFKVVDTNGEVQGGVWYRDGLLDAGKMPLANAIYDMLEKQKDGFPPVYPGMTIEYIYNNEKVSSFDVYDGEFISHLSQYYNTTEDKLLGNGSTDIATWTDGKELGYPLYFKDSKKAVVFASETDKLLLDTDNNFLTPANEFNPSNILFGKHSLDGNSNNNLIIGKNGARNTLSGGAGDDVIFGSASDNYITGGGGNDELHGGVGEDIAFFTGKYYDYSISMVQNSLQVRDSNTNDGDDGTDLLFNVEQLNFSNGIYQVTTGTFWSSVPQQPVAEDDVVPVEERGYRDIDVLGNDYDPNGSELAVISVGSAAHGTVQINGNHTVRYTPDAGYSGRDSFTYTIQNKGGERDSAIVSVLVGASGNIILGTSGDDWALNGDGSDNAIQGLGGDDDIDGGAGDDVLDGGAGDDNIYGGANNDLIYGGPGRDALKGGPGNDELYGGAGDDSFFGNLGSSNYFGGSGSDQYYFDMKVDRGWAGINESDSQGNDVIYLDNITGGDRIEFRYKSGQVNAYYYELETGAYTFGFAFSADNALIGRGVDRIILDGNKSYTASNIVRAAQNAPNGIFIYDIAEYNITTYPGLLPESGSGLTSPFVFSGTGGVGLFASYGSHASMTINPYYDTIYHNIFSTDIKAPVWDSTLQQKGFIVDHYVKEVIFPTGTDPDDIRLTVTGDDNAALQIHIENEGITATFDYFEDGYYLTGYSMSATTNHSGGHVVASNSASYTGSRGQSIFYEGEEPFVWTPETAKRYYFETLTFANGDSINLREMLHFEGTDAAEYLYGLDRRDKLSGYGGNDVIRAGDGADIISGGAGDDVLEGGTGDDVYRLASGFGSDILEENLGEGSDTIHFDGLSPENIRLIADGNGTLHIYNKLDASDLIRVPASITANNGESRIGEYVEKITFSDGTVWDLTAGLNEEGESKSDYIYGTAFDDVQDAMGGTDHLYGFAGNDTLNGGAGDDVLEGGTGDDVYRFASGFGSDILEENLEEGSDTIHFDGLSPENIRLIADGNGTLHIYNKLDASDLIRVPAGITNSRESRIGEYVEKIIFSDGTVWDLTAGLNEEGASKSDHIYGTAFDDVQDAMGGTDHLYGFAGNDTLNGGAGDDVLEGGTGDDVYRFASGFGSDILEENLEEGSDTIHFDGLSPENIRLIADGNGALHIYNKLDASDLIRVPAGITNSRESRIGEYVEKIIFSDGTVWDLTAGLNEEGASKSDHIYGTAFDDVQDAMGGTDHLYGFAGNDTLNGGAGNDTLEGGTGDDTAVFSGAFSDYVVSDYGDGSYRVADLRAGAPDGTDIIEAIEKLSFADGVYEDGDFQPVDLRPEPPAAGLALLLDPVNGATGVPDSEQINLTAQLAKTHSLAFETGTDVNAAQALYEEGGATKGLNMFIDGGSLYAAVWDRGEWGYTEVAADIDPGVRYTATLVMDGTEAGDGTLTLYVNGTQAAQAGGVGRLGVHSDDIGIGQVAQRTVFHDRVVGGPAAFTGTIEKLAHYNAALSGDALDRLDAYMAGGVTETPANRDPVADDDSAVTDEGLPVVIDVLSNDTDADGDTLSLKTITQGAGGSVVVNPDNTLTYTPDPGFEGADSFSYTLGDGQGGHDEATVSVTVNGDPGDPSVPKAPTADRVFLYDPAFSGNIPNSPSVNIATFDAKTLSASFETGADVSERQVIYEQGAATRGLNMYVEDGKLYMAVWNNAEENWGYKEVSADIAADTQYTATLVFDGALPVDGTITGYLNGAEIGQAGGVGLLYPHSGGIEVGASDGSAHHGAGAGAGYSFEGTVEKLVQYNAALSGADLDQLHDYMAYGLADTSAPIGETGTVAGVNHLSQTVSFEHSYTNPVVFIQPATMNGAQIATARITEVTDSDFTFSIQEADYLDGSHASEAVTWMAVEAGRWELDDGTVLEAGLKTQSDQAFQGIDFSAAFAARPSVLSQVQSANDPAFVSTRHMHIDQDGFDLAMREQDLDRSSPHGAETIGWLAIEQGAGNWGGSAYLAGSTGNVVTQNSHTLSFGDDYGADALFLAGIATYDGNDNAVLRARNKSATRVDLFIQEDQSADDEVIHTSEIVDYLVMTQADALFA